MARLLCLCALTVACLPVILSAQSPTQPSKEYIYIGGRLIAIEGPVAQTIVLSPATLQSARLGISYNQALTASGGKDPYTFTVTTGALPSGLSLSPAGIISGSPTATGSSSFVVQAVDSSTPSAKSGSHSYTLIVTSSAITITPPDLPTGTVGVFYTQTLTASGGTAPYTFAITSGTLPTGLSLLGGTISGTPNTAGNFNFTVTVNDSSPGPSSNAISYTITISSSSITLSPSSLPNAQLDTNYNQTVTASGGTPPYGFTISGGTLPAGLHLSNGGLLSGTPTAGGSFSFTVKATDQNNNYGTKTYPLTVNGGVISMAPTSPPEGTVNVNYGNQNINGQGGSSPYTFTMTSGSLPAGMHFSSGGVLYGTPTQSGNFPFTLQATDSSTPPYTGSQNFSLTINPNISISPTSLPSTTLQGSYSQTLTASGGAAPYVFTITLGTLPPGLSLSASGTLSGISTSTGTYNFTITATDSTLPQHSHADRAYTLAVNQVPAITSPNATIFAVGIAGTFTVTATGYPAPTLSESGALPNGITFNGTTHMLSGTPAASTGGTYPLTFTASNGVSPNATQTLTLTVTDLPPAISSLSVTSGPTSGGTALTIGGNNFRSAATVTFGGIAATVGDITANTIAVTTPAHPVGTADVVVTNPDGKSATRINGYTYTTTLSPPTVTAINPSAASNNVPVNIVSVAGSNFAVGWDRENGLVGNWRMDETSGANAADSSGYHNNGAASGTTIVPGKINNARNYSTDADNVTINNAPSLNMSGGFTVGFWINLSSGSDASVRQVFVKGSGAVGSREPAIFLGSAGSCGGNNRLIYRMDLTGGSNQGPCGTTSLSTGTWYYVAMVYDSSASVVSAYINGLPDATATTSGIPSSNTGNLYLGASPSYPSFRGSLDEVRFYNRALSRLEIYQLYLTTGPGSVTLSKPAQPTIACSGFIYTSPTSLSHGSCNTTGSAAGTWSAVVTNPDQQPATLPNGFAVTQPSPPPGYDDVLTSHPYYSYITTITARYVTAGCSSSPPLYCPDSYVTREQAAIFIERALGIFTPPWPVSQRFNDVGEERFSYAAIDDFSYRGFTSGCSASPPLYCPDSLVTREQMALFLEKAVGRTNPPTPPSQRFVDVVPSAWSYNWVDSFVSHGMDRAIMDVIKRGCNADGAHYCPTQPVTRGEMAAFLAIAFGW